jgi:hypothetical protein
MGGRGSDRTGERAPTRLLAMASCRAASRRAVFRGGVCSRVHGAANVVSLNDVQHYELPGFFSAPERRYRRWAYDPAALRADEVPTLSEHAHGQLVERLT